MRTLLFACTLSIAGMAHPQADSTGTAPAGEGEPARHALTLGVGTNGARVRVERTDSLQRTAQDDTLRISTRNKIIRIITSPRTDIDTTRDFERHLQDLRRERRNMFTYWAGIEVGINTFVTESGHVGDGPDSGPLQLNNARSRFLAINFMERKFEFGSHHIGLFTGLGLEFTGYKLSDSNRLMFNSDSTWAVAQPSPELRKNKLRQIGVRIPLMLELNTKGASLPSDAEALRVEGRSGGFSRKGNFHLAAGVVGSYYFDTMYKVRYVENGEGRKDRSKAGYNLLPYRLAARVQVGVGGLNLFGEYALTPMFEEGTAPALNALNVGLTLVGFN